VRNTDEYEISIPSGNAILRGDLAIPADADGVVIFAHGSGSGRSSPRNRMVAARLRERGLATLLLDLLTGPESSSDLTAELRFDIPFLTQRLTSATRWVREDKRLRGLGIGYFGASTGAAAALSAAVMNREIQAVVSRGGRTDLAGDVISWVDVPTLLIAGEFDHLVIEWNRETFRQMDCLKDFELIPGATHLFQEKGTLEQVADLAASWFERHLSTHREETKDHECHAYGT
jgi:dienelactone hydrolase